MNQIRAIRKRLMPSCAECRHSYEYRPIYGTGHYYCKRKQCVDHYVKKDCEPRNSVYAIDVRGRMYCKFERRNDEHDSD